MASINIQPDTETLAQVVARKSIDIMRTTLEAKGSCTWVLAGGSTPILAYRYIADNHLDDIDWSKITILIGDERIAPLDSSDSNWHQADQILLRHIPQAKLLRPHSNQALADAVDNYRQTIEQLPARPDGYPILDLVWLGVGEDGHTLSLFPGHPTIDDAASMILPVEDSPKPPSQRVTFGLAAFQATQHALIIAAGEAKTEVIARAVSGQDLPIAKVAQVVEKSGGEVEWMLDSAAGSQL